METALIVKVADGVYVANAAVDLNIVIKLYNISAIIRLESDDVLAPTNLVDMYDYALTGQELLDYEVQPMVAKLEAICNDIKYIRELNQCVLLQCGDGRNKSLLVAGYYLVKRLRVDPTTVITTLSQIYFTPTQIAAENEDILRRTAIANGEEPAPVSQESINTAATRATLRGLTNRSFRRIIWPRAQ